MESASVAAGHAHDEHDHHGPPAANVSSRVEAQFLGMLLFIISEIMLFGAFFTAYFFIRVVNEADWFPLDGKELPVGDRGREHRDPALLELHDALGARGRAQREPARAEVGLLTTAVLGLTFLTIQVNEYVHLGFAPSRQRAGHRSSTGSPACTGRTCSSGLTLLAMATMRAFRGPLHAEGAPRRGGARASTGTSSTSCGSSCTARCTCSEVAVLNPLRSEQEAFRFLIYVAVAWP